jgi:DedD protein
VFHFPLFLTDKNVEVSTTMPVNTKKLLWISLAVCGFVAIVLAAALLLFAPTKGSTQAPFDTQTNTGQTSSSTQDSVAVPSTAAGKAGTGRSGDVFIVYGDNQTTTTTSASSLGQTGTTVIVVPTTVSPAKTPSTTLQSKSVVPSTTPVTVQKKAATTVTTVRLVTETKPTNTLQQSQTATGGYWIQTGSFGTKSVADSLKATFTKHGISAIVSKKDIGGKSYYQVKAGPYSTKDEAKKMLESVKKVPGSSQKSFITTN